jgi:hypothetical protein
MLLTPTYFYSWMLSRKFKGPSWSWSYGSWIYNYLSNQYLSPLTLWVRIPLRQGVLDTTLCDKVCQWLTAGRWLSPGTPVSSTNKTDRHDITGILLEVALVVIGTDCLGSYKSNYHTITTTTAPWIFEITSKNKNMLGLAA